MDSFDLGRLTDFDFEVVCRDLFANLLGKDLELFSAGRDDGIDLRYFSPSSEHLVIQCKHWARSGRAALIRHMKDVELPKIQRLNPTRYILVSTVEMTKRAKDSLFEMLSPFVLTPSDIYGVDDIVARLQDRPDIIRRHLRLWLSSTAVLQSVLNKETLLRSTLLSEELDESLKLYAPNESFGRAARILEETRVCIIAGIPGIGKTTLAQVLAASYLDKGYELIEISEDADEVSKTWDESTPQFFYYDDFLGQTTLGDKLHKNEDSRLITLIRKIGRSSNKCLVLTTREYILAQARQQYARLDGPSFNIATCVLDLADYTRAVRAEILYNHIYHSSIPNESKAQFGKPEIYEKIIDHTHFNPRLIAQSLELPTKSAAESPNVVNTVIENLANPRHLWEHIVEHELNDSDVQLLCVLFTFSPRVPIDALEEAWSNYRIILGEPDSPRIFRKSVNTLENTMLRTELIHKSIFVSFHNPSVQDFLGEYVPKQRRVIRHLIKSIKYFEQITRLWTMASGRTRIGHLPSQGDGELMADIVQNSAVFEELVLTSLNGPSLDNDTERDWMTRRAVSLRIADKLGFDHIAHVVLNDLRNDWTQKAWSGDDVVDVVNAAAAFTKTPEDSIKAIVADAIEWIVSDTSDWPNARAAEQHLHELGSLVPGSALSSIQEDLIRKAEDELGNWKENSPDSISWSDLDEALDFAAQFSNPEEVFPGYIAANESMERHREETKASSVTNDEGSAGLDMDDDAKVHEIMRLLQEGSDRIS